MSPQLITKVVQELRKGLEADESQTPSITHLHPADHHTGNTGTELEEIIPTTMGEPLQYNDFQTFLDLCNENEGLRLNVTTNGSFAGSRKLVGGVTLWARRLVPITSDIKFSWNGFTAETNGKIMKGSDLGKMVSNLVRFIEIRDEEAERVGGNYCSVTLQLTFMEVNLKEIPDIVRMAIEYGVDRVKGHHLWVRRRSLSSRLGC